MVKLCTRFALVSLAAIAGSVGFGLSGQALAQSGGDTLTGTTPTGTAAAAGASKGRGIDFSKGRWGFGFGFPGGGSPIGSGYVGARYFVADGKSLGGYLLFGSDSSQKSNSFGLAGKFTGYLAQAERVNLYGFGQLSLGKNGGEANKDKDDMLIGLGGGGGVEFALLKDFSISGEAGLSFNTLPDGENAVALGTSALALNFYF